MPANGAILQTPKFSLDSQVCDHLSGLSGDIPPAKWPAAITDRGNPRSPIDLSAARSYIIQSQDKETLDDIANRDVDG